jgi:hypothetical protein
MLLQLRDGELLSVDAVWLSVVHGRVWVTCSNDPDDHFLDCGQAMRLAAGSRAIVGAEGAAGVTLAASPSWRDRLRACVRRWPGRPRSTAPLPRPRTA